MSGAFATLTVHDTLTLTTAATVPNTAAVSFYVSAGSVIVDAGVHIYLDTTAVILQSGGTFSTVAVAATPNVVTVHGGFYQTGGTVTLGGAGTVGALHVTGNVQLGGGSLASADVDSATGDSDRIAAEGRMEFGTAYTYDVVTVGVPLNTVFLPFYAKGGFVGGNRPTAAGYTVTVQQGAGNERWIQIKKN